METRNDEFNWNDVAVAKAARATRLANEVRTGAPTWQFILAQVLTGNTLALARANAYLASKGVRP